MSKRIALLGSTGSIGCNALSVIRALGFEVCGLAAGRNVSLLEEQVRAFSPSFVAVSDENAAEMLKSRLQSMPKAPEIFTGQDAAKRLVRECTPDMVLNAIVGIAGLSSTYEALKNGVHVALANKESLVAGGELIMQAQKDTGALLLPVDSEHSAIFQCLQDPFSKKKLRRIWLTASGGPFYGKSTEELASVTKKDALRHPNWSMGQKITIDSATLMNKGLELIEAMWLFSIAPSEIKIVVQRESIIHSMVEFEDYSILAQLGVPDMKLPIQYALSWPERFACDTPRLDFSKISQLTFGNPSEETFRCLAACRIAAEKGGLAACAANGANEQAVELFLRDEISFLDIGRLVLGCVEANSYAGGYTLSDVYACDAAARRYVMENK